MNDWKALRECIARGVVNAENKSGLYLTVVQETQALPPPAEQWDAFVDLLAQELQEEINAG